MDYAKEVPLVSVVIGVYNGAEHIKETIDSILNQSLENFELILVNDGSTDNTASVIHACKDPRIVFVDRKENRGLTRSLNEGVARARGTYIARLDCGDHTDAHRLQKQVSYLDAHPACAVLGTGVHLFYGEQTINTILFAEDTVAMRDELHRFMNPIPHSTLMMRRDAMTALGGYRVVFTLSQDYDLYLRAIERYQFHSLQEPLTHLRFDPHSLSYASSQQLIYGVAALASALHRRDGHTDVNTPEQWERLFQSSRSFIEQKRLAHTIAARTQGTLLKCALRERHVYDAFIAGTRMVSRDPFFFLKSRDGILNDIIADIDQLYPCAYHCKQFQNEQSFS